MLFPELLLFSPDTSEFLFPAVLLFPELLLFSFDTSKLLFPAVLLFPELLLFIFDTSELLLPDVLLLVTLPLSLPELPLILLPALLISGLFFLSEVPLIRFEESVLLLFLFVLADVPFLLLEELFAVLLLILGLCIFLLPALLFTFDELPAPLSILPLFMLGSFELLLSASPEISGSFIAPPLSFGVFPPVSLLLAELLLILGSFVSELYDALSLDEPLFMLGSLFALFALPALIALLALLARLPSLLFFEFLEFCII